MCVCVNDDGGNDGGSWDSNDNNNKMAVIKKDRIDGRTATFVISILAFSSQTD